MAHDARQPARKEIALSRSATSEVLRGLTLERRPFCLRRQETEIPSSGSAALASAERERRRGYEEGQAEGRKEGLRGGYEEGVRRGREEIGASARSAVESAVVEATRTLTARAERLSSLFDAIEATGAGRLRAMEDEMLALCYESVCAVLGSQAILPSTVQAHLQQTLASCEPGAVLLVHPQDAALMQELGLAAGGARWAADPAVTLGGCIVVQPAGAVDRRMETALARCKEVLLAARTLSEEAR